MRSASQVRTTREEPALPKLAGGRKGRVKKALQKSRGDTFNMSCHPATSSTLDAGTDFLQGPEIISDFSACLGEEQPTFTLHITQLLIFSVSVVIPEQKVREYLDVLDIDVCRTTPDGRQCIEAFQPPH